jgi:hypothetical protein
MASDSHAPCKPQHTDVVEGMQDAVQGQGTSAIEQRGEAKEFFHQRSDYYFATP